MKNSVLFAGPWVGEFGWELFCWHAYVRALSKFYDKTICVSSDHSRFLYDDFCDHFIGFMPNTGDYKDSYYKVGFNVTKELIYKLLMESDIDTKSSKISIFAPRRIGDPPRTHFADSFKLGSYNIVPQYKKFGTRREEYKNTIVIHARNRTLRSQDNWSENKWKILVDILSKQGYNIICIGLRSESMHIMATEDKRECDQQQLLDILASAKCIFGPSSGAMHLASLCGCPQVVWSTDYNLDRYTKNWNPLGTKVIFLSDYGWQPEPAYVVAKFMEWRNE